MLADNVKAREQDSTGLYHYVERKPDEVEINSQTLFCEMAHQVREAEEEKKRNYLFQRLSKNWLD